MCGHVINADICTCAVGYFPSSDDVVTPQQPAAEERFPPLQLLLSHNQLLAAAEFDSAADTVAVFGYADVAVNGGGSGGSSGYDSPSSLGSGGGEQSFMQRSVSSQNGFFGHFASAHEPINDSGPVRRAFSAGDLHRMNKGQQQGRRGESELWNESNAIIEGMSRTFRYSPEEKRERIQRYRSKRNLRNFNKRIKYECRKTLADSRPRIRGRFARNDETEEKNRQAHVGEQEEDLDTWASFLDPFSVNHFLNL